MMSENDPDISWPQRVVAPLGLPAGPCAWRASMLTDPAMLAYVQQHPSWIVIEPEDDDEVLAAVSPLAATMPVVVRMIEPDFTRRFEAQIRSRVEPLSAPAAAVSLYVEEPSELKSGGLMQILYDLRGAGLFKHIGLASDDVLAAEWLSRHTPARLIALPYTLTDQAARYRATAMAAEMGQACIAVSPIADDDSSALAFALGESSRVLPLRDKPLPEGWQPMDDQAIEAAWQAYQAAHPAPPPLPRGRPPE